MGCSHTVYFRFLASTCPSGLKQRHPLLSRIRNSLFWRHSTCARIATAQQTASTPCTNTGTGASIYTAIFGLEIPAATPGSHGANIRQSQSATRAKDAWRRGFAYDLRCRRLTARVRPMPYRSGILPETQPLRPKVQRSGFHLWLSVCLGRPPGQKGRAVLSHRIAEQR